MLAMNIYIFRNLLACFLFIFSTLFCMASETNEIDSLQPLSSSSEAKGRIEKASYRSRSLISSLAKEQDNASLTSENEEKAHSSDPLLPYLTEDQLEEASHSSHLFSPSICGSEIEKTIRSLIPFVRGQRKFAEGFESLTWAEDKESLKYLEMLNAKTSNKPLRKMVILDLKRNAWQSFAFLSFLNQTLENFLQIHTQVRDKNAKYYNGVRQFMTALWEEINEVSHATASDIATTLYFGWKKEDSRWVCNKSSEKELTFAYVSTKAWTSDVQEKSDFLKLLFENKQAFTQLSSQACKTQFYKVCGTNVIAIQTFEELMFYQEINSTLALYKDLNQETRSDHRFIIDQIQEKLIRQHGFESKILEKKLNENVKQFVDDLLKSLVDFVKYEKLAIKKEKARMKKRQQKAKKKEVRKTLESVTTPVAPAAETGLETEVAPAPKPQKPQKLLERKSKELSSELLFTKKYPHSVFSAVVLKHESGTVNTKHFKKFLNDVGGRFVRRQPNGMTRYFLPNLGADKDQYPDLLYCVHLPHGESEDFYPAILYHFIRPSIQHAGFTLEMFE